jgi:predicted GNAT family acetyltransferase
MTSISITLDDNGEREGRYIGRVEGLDGEAELVFTRRGHKLVSADHTFAPVNMRGSGVAMALVQRLIADARAQGFRIIPLCPYISAKYLEHPEWRDVMATLPGEKPRVPA